METTWPRSSSPCSAVLKFTLASTRSPNVASADSLDWVMGLFDTFREVDLGPRDRLGSVSYSKAFTRAMRTEARGELRPPAAFHSRKKTPRRPLKIFARPLRASEREPTLRVPVAPDASSQMSTAREVATNGDGVRGAATRMPLCGCQRVAIAATGKGRRGGSIRMPSGGCQRVQNGAARPEIAGLFIFECRMSNAECRMTLCRVLHSAFSILHSSPSASIAHR